MAGIGPPPTPTPVLRLRGSALVAKREKAGEPIAPEGVPTPPRPLKGEALAHWNRTLPLLQALRVASPVDADALYVYSEIWASYLREINPDRKLRLRDQLLKYMIQFGLTPSSRARVKVEPPKQEDRTARFFA